MAKAKARRKPKAKTRNKSPARPKARPAAGAQDNSDFRQAARRQSLAILVGLLAIAIIVGGFGWGGPGPTMLFDGLAWLIGWSAWIIAPGAAIFLAWTKFHQQNQPLGQQKLLAIITGLLAVNGLLHLPVDPAIASDVAQSGSHGGQIGYWLAAGCREFLNTPASFILLLTLAMINLLMVLGTTPRHFFSWLAGHFRSRQLAKEAAETGLGPVRERLLPERETKPAFRLHKGVPAETKSRPVKTADEVPPGLEANPDGSALTLSADPNWKFPPLSLLNQKQDKADAGDVQTNAETIRETLANFNIDVEMEGANIGPRVTQYTLKPPSGIKLAKITGLESNVALDLAAQSIRIEAPIPGQRAVGIEVPNRKPASVLIHSLLTSTVWRSAPPGSMTFAIGKDTTGNPVIAQLEKMPHLLLAGQTGSGKSVAINTLITSLLYRLSPSELKLIMVDPKQVELAPYNDIPHLLTPVITEPEKCISALKWAVAEMERRLRTFAGVGKRNIGEFNELDDTQSMPFVVIVIDELADLMMMAARDVEALVVRVAQKARAAGIHLVLATQRPSVDVITGLIKANVPGRIAFTVASQVDSRTIIDQGGAEKLLGLGDILYMNASLPKPKRVQGALITDTETVKICQFLRKQQPVEYDGEVVSQPVSLSSGRGGGLAGGGDEIEDDLWEAALGVVVDAGKASTSLLQRRLRIGYARAARIVEAMEDKNIVAPADGARPRDVLISSVTEGLNPELATRAEADDDDSQEPDEDGVGDRGAEAGPNEANQAGPDEAGDEPAETEADDDWETDDDQEDKVQPFG